jgi:hypothetical protein
MLRLLVIWARLHTRTDIAKPANSSVRFVNCHRDPLADPGPPDIFEIRQAGQRAPVAAKRSLLKRPDMPPTGHSNTVLAVVACGTTWLRWHCSVSASSSICVERRALAVEIRDLPDVAGHRGGEYRHRSRSAGHAASSLERQRNHSRELLAPEGVAV